MNSGQKRLIQKPGPSGWPPRIGTRISAADSETAMDNRVAMLALIAVFLLIPNMHAKLMAEG
jgi:hypothetical protein